MSDTRRILGIDPGLRVTGFGLLIEHRGKLVYVTSGCIRASGDSLPVRLGIIARDIAHVIAEERPTEVAVERVFVNMNAFRGLANVSQATLANVAPGIAEALIATAIGLFAAIPAVVAYNRYTHDVDRLATRYETFIEEFSNILQRQ